MTAVISAVIGAGLMFLALGPGRPSGIEGWTPLNESVEAAIASRTQLSVKAETRSARTEEKAEAAAGKDDKEASGRRGTDQPDAAVKPGTTKPPGSTDGLAAGSLPGNGAVSNPGNPVAAGGPGAEARSETEPEPLVQNGLISINTAGTVELQEIPGIGEKKAKAIVDYRNEHGPFKLVDELTNVKGIGEKMLEKMRPHIGL
ncbi:ComEA family DNA-binding protein [Paenibacillus faecis]|nr:helix-hairpin-helix domain-containing protein [Paenibacillus faecis]